MRRWLLGLLLLPLLCRGAEPEQLRVMTDLWPPFRMRDETGAFIGLDIDLLAELSRRSGLRFEIEQAPWARGLAELEQGRASLMTGLAKTPERERYIQYLDKPYYRCSPRFYATPAIAVLLRDYASLRGLRIGYVLESVYFEPFDTDRALDKFGVNNEAQLLDMLVLGRIDALVGTDCQVDHALLDPALSGRIVKAAYHPQAQIDLYIGFSRRRPAHLEQVQAALDSMLADGWVMRAAQRYRTGGPVVP